MSCRDCFGEFGAVGSPLQEATRVVSLSSSKTSFVVIVHGIWEGAGVSRTRGAG